LDLGLPDMSGIEVLEGPARLVDRTGDRVIRTHRLIGQGRALDAGADDYVTKRSVWTSSWPLPPTPMSP
jgi:DNA-binding response OmpR family regulator